jgi:hypothetical protein
MKAAGLALVAEVNETELAIRIIEAMVGLKRPEGWTLGQVVAATEPASMMFARAAARAALGYVAECLEGAERVQ